MVTLPSSSALSSSAPLSLSPSIGWKTTAALGIGLPLVERSTVPLIVAVAGGGVYLRRSAWLCDAAKSSGIPANNSTALEIQRQNGTPMGRSIDNFGRTRHSPLQAGLSGLKGPTCQKPVARRRNVPICIPKRFIVA